MSENSNDSRQLQKGEKQPNSPQYALRLQLFADWPKNIQVKKDLAEARLFYSGYINFKIKDLLEIIVDLEGQVEESPSKVDNVTDLCTATKCIDNGSTIPDIVRGLETDMAQPQYADYVRRLESFNAWPVNIPVSKEKFAQAGLVYTGVGDSVRCYYCDAEMSNWENSDVLMKRHAKCSPMCPQGLWVCNDADAKQNVIYRTSKVLGTDDEKFPPYANKSELQKILDKYAANSQWRNADVAQMEHAGQHVRFPKTAIERKSENDWKDMIDDTLSVDGIDTDDEESSSESGQAGDNVAVEEQAKTIPKPTEANMKTPKFYEYAVYSKRLETFESWPDHIPIKKEDLAKAGLFYTGKTYTGTDLVKILLELEDGNGSSYLAVNVTGNPHEFGRDEHTSNASQISRHDPITRVAVQSCIQMGFSEEMVKKAIDVYVNTTGKDYTGTDMCEILLELDDQSSSLCPTDNAEGNISRANETERDELGDEDNELSLEEENKRLKESFMCIKEKCTEERCVVFIPCGHLVCCNYCASNLIKCPICRTKIDIRQKVLFACSNDVNR